MIEGEAFGAMRAFAQDAMEWMAKRRLEAAERRRAKERAAAPERTSRSKKALDDAIADPGVPETAQTAIRKAMKTYDQSREREVTRLHKEVQLYRTLSTAGITAATFAHESSGNPIKIITVNAKTVRRRAKKELGDDYGPLLQKPVDGILQATQSLAVLGDATLKLVAHDKRRLSRVEIHDVIGRVLATFEPFLAGRDVKPQQCLCGGNPYLRASEAAVESIITNLLNNSVTAFEQSSVSQREIRIVTEIEEDTLVLRVLDNGPGIESINVRDIWLPGQTTRANGTGLGLTIVRDTVSDLGGEVDAIEHGELGGAEMIVHLPILGE
jgi:C4-dicarboxylate-specific signal transduction histidine kinase